MPVDFLPCRIEGDKFQDFILNLIREWDKNAVQIPGNFAPYDIFLPNLERKIEVKFDFRSKTIGVGGVRNIAIEFKGNKGQPSGITSTKADTWCHCFWNEDEQKWVAGFFKTEKLRELCEGKPTRPSREGAMNYLIPVTDALNILEKTFEYPYEQNN